MRSIQYKDIPSVVRSLYGEEQVLFAGLSDTRNSIVLWIANPTTHKQTEIEYSNDEKRFLSFEERLSALAGLKRIDLTQEGLYINKSYAIEKDSGTLYERYALYDSNKSTDPVVISQIYHTPYRETEERVIGKLIKQIETERMYSSMNKQQRAAYWADRLYKQRRQIGESGGNENAIFDEKLLEDMRESDLKFREILPDVLRELAVMEQTNYPELADAFQKGTGEKVP